MPNNKSDETTDPPLPAPPRMQKPAAYAPAGFSRPCVEARVSAVTQLVLLLVANRAHARTHAEACARARKAEFETTEPAPSPPPSFPLSAKYKCNGARIVCYIYICTDVYIYTCVGRMHRVAHKRSIPVPRAGPRSPENTAGSPRSSHSRSRSRSRSSSFFALSLSLPPLFILFSFTTLFFSLVRLAAFQWLALVYCARYRLIHESRPSPFSLSLERDEERISKRRSFSNSFEFSKARNIGEMIDTAFS